MRRIHNSVIRLSILTCLTIGGIAVNSPAVAECMLDIVCLGNGALSNVTSGYLNTGIGYGAAHSTTSGSKNTALGAYSLEGNTTGSENTATGNESLYLSNGSYNTATGSMSLRGNTTGSGNTASGYKSLASNNTGSHNTAVGREALKANTSAYFGTAIGYRALASNVTGLNNTATGVNALLANTAGNDNTANGAYALQKTVGNANTAMGKYALYAATTGFRNVALGVSAGSAVVSGSDNIIIGALNQGTAAENGVIRIGASTYQTKAFVAGIRSVQTGATGAVAVLIDANGQLGTINSSRRFKEDIQPMGSVSEKLFGLRPVTFRYKQPYDDGSKPIQFGLVAEEVAQVFPELVVIGKDGKPETVSYHLLATLLLNEVQKDHRVMQMQTARTEAMEQQVQTQAEQLAALRRDNESQATRMAALEQQVAVLAKALGPMAKDRLVASAK